MPAAPGHSPLLLNWHPSQAEIDGARSCGTRPSTTAVTFCRPLAAAMQGNLLTESEQTPDSNQRLTEPAESERPPGCADRAGAGAQVIRLWHAVTGGCGRGRRGERPSAQVRASVQLMLAKRRAASHWDGDGLAEGAGVRSRPRCRAPGRRDQTARAASRVSSRAPMTISPTHRRYPILARRQSRDSRGRRGP
jgi:hypothetical protein